MKYKVTIKTKKKRVTIKLKKNFLECKTKKTKTIFKIPKEVITKRFYIEGGANFTGKILGFPLDGKFSGSII